MFTALIMWKCCGFKHYQEVTVVSWCKTCRHWGVLCLSTPSPPSLLRDQRKAASAEHSSWSKWNPCILTLPFLWHKMLQDFFCSSAPHPTLCPVLHSSASEEKRTRHGWMSNAINPKSIHHFTFAFYLSSQRDFYKAVSYKLSPLYPSSSSV